MDRVARICFVLGLARAGVRLRVCSPAAGSCRPTTSSSPLADSVVAATRYFTEADYLTFDSPHAEGRRRRPPTGAAAAPGLTFIPHYDGEQFVADLIDLDGPRRPSLAHQLQRGLRRESRPRPVRRRRLRPRLARHASLPGRQPAVELRGPAVPVRRRAGEAGQGFAGRLEARAQHASCGDRGRGRHDLGAVPELPARGHGRAARASSPGSTRTPS